MASAPLVFKLWWAPLAVACLAWAGAAAGVAGQAPDDDWRTLETEHFRVTFPRRLEGTGRRAAARAEVAYDELSRTLVDPGGGTIDLLVTDHADLSNGLARVKPSRRVTVYAVPPTDGLDLAYYDDWLELVITHELAHVFHLDHTNNPIGSLGRAIFGRAPTDWPLFPGLSTPDWVIEGLATWYESKLTTAGRVRGTSHEMEIRTAVLEGRFEGLGQASGRSPLWPGGNRSYLYGSMFFEHLTERYGDDAMGAFVEAVAGQWIPFRIDSAARDAFGVSFSEAWRAWRDELEERYADLDRRLSAVGPVTEPERLTDGARWALQPKVSPDGSTLTYTRADGRSDTQLRHSAPDGAGSRELARTNGIATYGWMPDGRLLFSQLENTDPYSAYGDLYFLDGGGRSTRLTHGARLSEPSAAPDGRWAAAVQQIDGTNALVRVDLSTGEVLTLQAPDPGVQWAFPAVSPDGRWIAVSRWQEGGLRDLAILDVTAAGRRIVSRDRAVDTAPSWSPDGRWIVWASDRTGISNVLAVGFDPATGTTGVTRMLTNVRTGVAYPSVDPTGRWLYFSGYHADGWEAERVPFDPIAAPLAPPALERFAAPTPLRSGAGEAAGTVEGFSPWHTLWPRYWEPRFRDALVAPARVGGGLDLRRRELLGFAVGAETSSVDLVGRHEYSAYAQVFTSGGGRAEGGLSYTYRGLGNPVFSLDASQSWSSAGRLVSPPDTSFVLERDRAIGASATLLSKRWRRALALTLGGDLSWAAFEQLDNGLNREPLDPSLPSAPRFGGLSAALSFSTARDHTFQTGNTQGMSLYLEGRRRVHLNVPAAQRDSVGRDFSYDELYGRFRGYVPLWRVGYATHVLALQGAAGGSFGPLGSQGLFGVGGASGTSEDVTGFTLFGGHFVPLPVRGYEQHARFGRWAWAATAEYRFPIALVHRGAGPWPLHLDRLVGSVFADAGNAWEPSPRGDPLVSVGAELSAQMLALYDGSLLLRTGFAVPLVRGYDPSVYVRVGVPF